MLHTKIEQTLHPTTRITPNGGAEANRSLDRSKITGPLETRSWGSLIDRVIKGLFAGFCLTFGLAFAVFIYAIIFDMRDLMQVTSFRLTQLGLVIMVNLMAIVVRAKS